MQSVWVAGVSYGSAIGSAAAGLYDEFVGICGRVLPGVVPVVLLQPAGRPVFAICENAEAQLFLSGDVDVFAGKQATEEVVKSMPAPVYHVSCPTLDST